MSKKNDVDQKKTPPDVSKLLPYQKRIVFRLVRAMLNGLDEKQVKTVSRAVARVTKHSDGQKNKSPYIRYYSKILLRLSLALYGAALPFTSPFSHCSVHIPSIDLAPYH